MRWISYGMREANPGPRICSIFAICAVPRSRNSATIISCVGSYIVFLPAIVKRVDKDGLDHGVSHPIDLCAKHTYLSTGGQTFARTNHKLFILRRRRHTHMIGRVSIIINDARGYAAVNSRQTTAEVFKVPLAMVVARPLLRLEDQLGSLHPSLRGDRMHQYQARAVARRFLNPWTFFSEYHVRGVE